ncbi:MAG: S8 family peptidase [Elusimicrobia bacterium]|nr:S8 family peptidase [Elusimicrobiota bacterium]
MSKWLWIFALALALGSPARAQYAALTAQGAEDRLIVAFQSGISTLDQRQIVDTEGLKVLREIPALKVILIEAPRGQASALARRLEQHPQIARVAPDIWRRWIDSNASLQDVSLPAVEAQIRALPRFKSNAFPWRPLSPEAPWGVRRVNAMAAWPRSQGAGVKVGVVDTGIDPNHPDLKGRVKGGHNSLDKNAPWHDDHFHGTHVAGIIAAELNGYGVAGVAPQADLYAVKVLTKDGSGSLFSIMDGIIWCAQNGINVINMSLGAAQEIPFLQMALQMAAQQSTIVCAAGNGDGKGNSSPVGYPAKYEECIAVSALDQNDGITRWSSRGPEVDFIAPGLQVPSTVPLSHDPSGVKAYSGTSMATPHVSGLAALAVSLGAATPDQVRSALSRAAQRLPNLSSDEQGGGVINAGNLAR